MTRWKPNDPPSAAQPRDDSGFDQSLSVDSDIVAFTTERTNEPARRDPPGTPGSTQREPTLDHSDELDELLIPFINNPVDAGLGKRVPERCRHRNRMNDIAEGAQADNENTHLASGVALRGARVRFGPGARPTTELLRRSGEQVARRMIFWITHNGGAPAVTANDFPLRYGVDRIVGTPCSERLAEHARAARPQSASKK